MMAFEEEQRHIDQMMMAIEEEQRHIGQMLMAATLKGEQENLHFQVHSGTTRTHCT